MKKMISLAALVLTACQGSATTEHEAAADVPAYVTAGTGPLVVLIAVDMNETVNGSIMHGIAQDLVAGGFTVLSLDPPCHGADAEVIEGLACWRRRMEAGDTTLFRHYCEGLSAVLTARGERIAAVVGQSRGGFLAVACAAADPRLSRLALVAPVTDLQRLAEFDGYAVDEVAFGLAQYVPDMLHRRVLVRTNEVDLRVGADLGIAYAHAIHAELQVLRASGHAVANNGEVRDWLLH